MSNESKESHPHPSLALTFFNYPKAIATLKLQLQALELEYTTLSSKQNLLTSTEEPPPAIVIAQNNDPALENPGQNKIVFIDQEKVIKSLRKKIAAYQAKIDQLKLEVSNKEQVSQFSMTNNSTVEQESTPYIPLLPNASPEIEVEPLTALMPIHSAFKQESTLFTQSAEVDQRRDPNNKGATPNARETP